MFWVYILHCADGSYYTGHTDSLERRMGQYQAGECDGYVAARRPVKLAWSQECATRDEALSAEMQIKGWSRKKKEAMMRGDWNEVSRLARSQTMPQAKPNNVSPEPTELTSVRPEPVEGPTESTAVRPEPVEGKIPNPFILRQAQDERLWKTGAKHD